jgi:hypothetical protein
MGNLAEELRTSGVTTRMRGSHGTTAIP